ncbi:hypothetical protein EDD16DRAFT_1025549 [Pisolithus croceorrhizus]|nr:hypothetical protein EV401DRAFT_154079 [Pisolithus croceorrhizus]KAI6130762.1 hypothetical protein EDD16DRAFT_1025549 [Pisolithus croceorrhizus]
MDSACDIFRQLTDIRNVYSHRLGNCYVEEVSVQATSSCRQSNFLVLGIAALMTCSYSLVRDAECHDNDWHGHFSSFLRCSLDCFDMPVLPQLSLTGLTLCHALDQDYSEAYQDGGQLRLSTAVMVAVVTFLRSKDADLYGCRSCQDICMEFLAGTLSTVESEVADYSEGEALRLPLAFIRGIDDTLGVGLSSLSQGPSEVHTEGLAGMDAFMSMLYNPTLSKDQVQLQVDARLLKLVSLL